MGTDRFIWLAFKPNGRKEIRLYSDTFADEGVLSLSLNSGTQRPPPKSKDLATKWARFPHGVLYALSKAGLTPTVMPHNVDTGCNLISQSSISLIYRLRCAAAQTDDYD